MDNTSKLDPHAAANSNSQPVSDPKSSQGQTNNMGGSTSPTPDSRAQRPAGGEALASARQGAHVAVDAVADKAAPFIDAVYDKVGSVKDAAGAPQQAVKDAMDAAVNSADEWIGAARDAIRGNPFAAIAGALLVGAAYVSLTSRRR